MEGNFLSHHTTLENYKKAYWFPDIFEHQSLGNKGHENIREKAKQIAEKKIAEHQFALPHDIQKELDRIYKKAEEKLR